MTHGHEKCHARRHHQHPHPRPVLTPAGRGNPQGGHSRLPLCPGGDGDPSPGASTHTSTDPGTVTEASRSLQDIFGGQKGLRGAVWGGAVSAAAKALTHSQWTVRAAPGWGRQAPAARQGPALPSGSARETSCQRHGFPNRDTGNSKARARLGAKYEERKHPLAACYLLF